MADHVISLSRGANMSQMEGLSWGPSESFPDGVVASTYILASSTTAGVTGSLDFVSSSGYSVDNNGMVHGTLINAQVIWGNGASLAFDANDPISGVSVADSGRSLHVDWHSFLGGNDTFQEGTAQGSVIDGGGGINTVVYSDSSTSNKHTIAQKYGKVFYSEDGKVDTLISIQKIQFSDKTVDLSTLNQPPASFAVFDTTTGQSVSATPTPYSGPVSGLQNEYINITHDSLSVTAASDNWFIHTGYGTDAVALHGGTNVVDGGMGSNFLAGGTGTDTFFVDDRNAAQDIWSTVANFHSGDSATIWGLTANDFAISWLNEQGAAGYTGLTLHASAPGKPTASISLSGWTTADLNNGRLSASFGYDSASGSSYLYLHANS